MCMSGQNWDNILDKESLSSLLGISLYPSSTYHILSVVSLRTDLLSLSAGLVISRPRWLVVWIEKFIPFSFLQARISSHCSCSRQSPTLLLEREALKRAISNFSKYETCFVSPLFSLWFVWRRRQQLVVPLTFIKNALVTTKIRREKELEILLHLNALHACIHTQTHVNTCSYLLNLNFLQVMLTNWKNTSWCDTSSLKREV